MLGTTLTLTALGYGPRAHAQTQVQSQGETPPALHLFNQTAGIVDVVDSFDHGSQFSFRLSAGYTFTRRSTEISRELRVSDPATSTGLTQTQHVADYTEGTHTLLVAAELGLFRDLSLTFGLPVVLSNTRQLRPADGVASGTIANTLRDGWSRNGAPTLLFDPNFNSPERSGIDQLHLGIRWAIFNQQRDRSKPTWLVNFEWRPPVGDPMQPCAETTASVVCPAASSVPPLPSDGGTNSTGSFTRQSSGLGPGVSRGFHGVYFQTALSRRLGYVEPYAGFDFLAEFPIRSSPFHYFDTPYGQLSNFPPLQSSLTVGLEVIPWENRETWQRMVIDLRLQGTYRSQGRDYSPLYDALGTSSSVPLLQPGCPSNARATDGSCQASRQVYFDGLTTNASHVILGGNINISVQPAKFLRFNLGMGVSWASPHAITNTDACNPSQAIDPRHPEWRGGCVGNAAPDPTHRNVIDAPGGRFITSNDVSFNVMASIALTPRFY